MLVLDRDGSEVRNERTNSLLKVAADMLASVLTLLAQPRIATVDAPADELEPAGEVYDPFPKAA